MAAYILNIAHTVHMLNVHTDSPFLYIYSKTQPPAACTLHGIAKYVSKTNMPTKLSIYAEYLTNVVGDMCTYKGTIQSPWH